MSSDVAYCPLRGKTKQKQKTKLMSSLLRKPGTCGQRSWLLTAGGNKGVKTRGFWVRDLLEPVVDICKRLLCPDTSSWSYHHIPDDTHWLNAPEMRDSPPIKALPFHKEAASECVQDIQHLGMPQRLVISEPALKDVACSGFCRHSLTLSC